MRPRIPKAVARRIDRASRAAHAFHRFAHHPLCGAYAQELFTLGRVRLCRGCTFVLAGVCLGAGLAFVPHAPQASVAVSLAAAALFAGSRPLRLPKVASRLLPAIGLGFACASGGRPALGATVLATALVIFYRRRGPHRAPCAACPERTAAVCSGFRPIVQREKAFQRLSSRWLHTLPGWCQNLGTRGEL